MALAQVNWRPDAERLRGFGYTAFVVFAAIGGWVGWRQTIFGLPLSAGVAVSVTAGLWVLALVCLLLGRFRPTGLRPLYLVLTAIGLPLRLAISGAALLIVFYVVVTPIGLALRLLGRDPLRRRFDPDAPTYWVRRRPVRDVRRYFHQF